MELCQGELIRIEGWKGRLFIVVSKNAFIRATGCFHICPVLKELPEGPLHTRIRGKNGTEGIAVCEQLKLIDPAKRSCTRKDSLPYAQIMNLSDALQGIFEYD